MPKKRETKKDKIQTEPEDSVISTVKINDNSTSLHIPTMATSESESVIVKPDEEVIFNDIPSVEVEKPYVPALAGNTYLNLKLLAPVSVSLLLLVGASISLNYFVVRHQSESKVLGTSIQADPAEKARQDAKELIEKIGSMVMLPENDEPSIATVIDLAPLAGQAFFEKAKIGDKTLVYEKSGKAYLYRPSESKIVEFGLFQPSAGASSEQKLGIDIRNGSSVTGMATKLKEHLSQFGKYGFKNVGNASKKYELGFIVDLSKGKRTKEIKELADYLKLQVKFVMPEGEKVSKAEAVVMIGEK